MQSAVPIGGKLTRYMVPKSASGSKQAATNEEGDQLLYQSFPCFHQSFSESDCHNLVGKCWPHKS